MAQALAPCRIKCSNSVPNCFLDCGKTGGFDPGGVGQPRPHVGICEMKHQIIGSQAWNVALSVEAFERIVEVVRQEDSFDARLRKALILPIRFGHLGGGFVVQGLPVGNCDPVVGESEKLAAKLDEPAHLNRVVQMYQRFDQPTNLRFRVETLFFDPWAFGMPASNEPTRCSSDIPLISASGFCLDAGECGLMCVWGSMRSRLVKLPSRR